MSFLDVALISTVMVSVVNTMEGVTINKSAVRGATVSHLATGYISCFCNLASCVTTGYVCKSIKGGCFSDISDQSANGYKGHHGCIEHLPDDEGSRCQTRSGMHERTVIRRKENPRSLFLCCHNDLCNHIDSPQTKNLLNSTLLSNSIAESQEQRYQHRQEAYLYSDSDVWFRAATIAVPICGAVILFVLVALAVKILKSEHHDSAVHKLGPAMYIRHLPEQCKTVKDYQNGFNKAAYADLLRKDYVPVHHNVFLGHSNPEDISAAHLPLLAPPLQSAEADSAISSSGYSPTSSLPTKSDHIHHSQLMAMPVVPVGWDKNETNAKLNLINESEKSIVFEIEKGPVRCPDVNLVTFAPAHKS